MNIVEAAHSGDRLATLTALRDSIAATIQGCESGRDMASLSKRLMEIMDEIDALKVETATDELDEVLNVL